MKNTIEGCLSANSLFFNFALQQSLGAQTACPLMPKKPGRNRGRAATGGGMKYS
ncbi:MAG: hypothetical protein AB1724_05300 [Thermodesulfobacteriota bacterium]